MLIQHKIYQDIHLPEEADTFIGYIRELQNQASEMMDVSQDEFEKELFVSIYKLTISAEKKARSGKMDEAWKDVGRIINKAFISDMDK